MLSLITVHLNTVRADIIGTIPNLSVYNGHSFPAFVYSGDYDRFQAIYNKIPDTFSMDIPFSTAANAYIALNDAFSSGGVTKGYAKYISENIKVGADIGTVMQDQMIKLVNFPTTKAETKKVQDALPAGVDKSTVKTMGKSKKIRYIEFVDETLNSLRDKLNLTDEEGDILITAIFVGEIKFKITKFDFVPGTKNKISFAMQKVPVTLTPAAFTKLVGAKKSVIDYLKALFTAEAPYVDGTILRNISSITPSAIKISGTGFSPVNNAVKFTKSSTSQLNIQKSALVATPQSFMGRVSSFFGGIWSFFKKLIPFTHGQTSTSSGQYYVVYDISSDNASGTSISLAIPANIPNGVYRVSVASDNGNWLSTDYKITVASGVATVSGNAGINNGVYVDGAIIPATATYKCPNNTATATYTLTSANTCLMTLIKSSGGFTRVVIGGSSGTLPAGSVTVPAILTYVCPTIPTGTTGYFSLVSGSTCVFHASAPGTPGPTTTNPPTTTTTSTTTVATSPTVTTTPTQVSVAAKVIYTCPSGSTLSGTNCQSVDMVGVVANATYKKLPTGLFGYAYSCAVGYTLKNMMCYSNAIKITPATVVYSCATGYTLNATTKMCVK